MSDGIDREVRCVEPFIYTKLDKCLKKGFWYSESLTSTATVHLRGIFGPRCLITAILYDFRVGRSRKEYLRGMLVYDSFEIEVEKWLKFWSKRTNVWASL